MGLFTRNKTKGSARVGPIMHSFYERMDPGYREAFVEFISGAPSGGELVATYKHAPIETATDICLAFEKTGLPGHGVIGAQGFESGGFAIYIKGDFDEEGVAELAQAFKDSGERFGLDVDVDAGRFTSDELSELT